MNKNEDNSQVNLVCKFHDHSHIRSCDHAALFKTGILDVELLKTEGQHYEALNECSVVGVRFRAMTLNFATKRKEPVFEVHASNGQHVGSFFSSAFVSLTL